MHHSNYIHNRAIATLQPRLLLYRYRHTSSMQVQNALCMATVQCSYLDLQKSNLTSCLNSISETQSRPLGRKKGERLLMCFRGGEANRMAASVWGSKVSKSISIPFSQSTSRRKNKKKQQGQMVAKSASQLSLELAKNDRRREKELVHIKIYAFLIFQSVKTNWV